MTPHTCTRGAVRPSGVPRPIATLLQSIHDWSGWRDDADRVDGERPMERRMAEALPLDGSPRAEGRIARAMANYALRVAAPEALESAALIMDRAGHRGHGETLRRHAARLRAAPDAALARYIAGTDTVVARYDVAARYDAAVSDFVRYAAAAERDARYAATVVGGAARDDITAAAGALRYAADGVRDDNDINSARYAAAVGDITAAASGAARRATYIRHATALLDVALAAARRAP